MEEAQDNQQRRDSGEEAQVHFPEIQSSVQLLLEWLDIHLDIRESERGAIHTFLTVCQDNIDTLYGIYESLYAREEKHMLIAGRYSFGIESNRAWLLYEQGKICMPTAEWRRIIAKGIQFLEELLPLGSVVELKKDILLLQIPALEAAGSVRAVITDRYLPVSAKSYYPYAGVPYPVGTGGRKRNIYFTQAMIERVVSRGYSDEQEAAFQRLIQKTCLLEKDMDICSFAPEEEQHGGTL